MKTPFIVIEGLEGAGKSTAIKFVCEWLEEQHIAFLKVREPGGTPLAEAARALLKQPWDETVASETELLLVYAARAQLVQEVIQPALKQGTLVISDRHDLSTRAYQGGGRGISQQDLNFLRNFVLKGLVPDLTIYLDIQPEIGLARAQRRGTLDRIEQEDLAFFKRVRDHYLQEAQADPSIFLVDAQQPLETVRAHIRRLLTQQLLGRL